jgi:hypothetical protein
VREFKSKDRRDQPQVAIQTTMATNSGEIATQWIRNSKASERIRNCARSGTPPPFAGRNENYDGIIIRSKATRDKALLLAALRLWELKRGIRE